MIKVWDYLDEFSREKEEILAAVEKVLESGWLILGEEVKRFESEFAAYCDVEFGVGVNSGTDALFIALRTLGLGEGDEVITVANTAVPTVSAIVSSGAVPRFVDIDINSYLMDTELIESALTEKTRCILPVHLYGQCVNMERVGEIARRNGLHVVEDCAQSHGATYNKRKAGSMSDIAAFSFYPTKILGGYGDGGMVLTNQEEWANRARRLRFYGMDGSYYALEHGYNTRLDEIHAAILSRKLQHIGDYIARRRKIAARYQQALRSTSLILPTEAENCRHAYYLYVCRHPKRDDIIVKLRRADIHLNVSYPWPIHTMRAYGYLGYEEGDLPQTEKVAREVFSLPMYPGLTDEALEEIVDAIRNIVEEVDAS